MNSNGTLAKTTHFITHSRVWKSFFRHAYPDNDLDRALVMNTNFLLHLMPVKVSRHSLKATYSFGLGVISLFLFVELVITGMLLMFYYIPSIERAYSSMLDLQFSVPLGLLFRNMHRWGAHAMVLAVALHMVRVFYTGAYKPPREFNWVIGVVLLLLTLGLSFTGYLLPWDQLSFWAITVGTNIAGAAPLLGNQIRLFLLGGPEVGQAALLRFYVLHIMVLPPVLLAIVSVHLWRVRKDGGLARPEEGKS
ncbi:MAG: cytochrome b N-terminal domain-containing protein [Chloroflexi bacterium]|nr:cytochrome b N-terminal domain-containing protein [Chloroflexota bacterium]